MTTGIEWTDETWNPVAGCDRVSPGCDHCYAESIAKRFAGSKAFPDGFKVTLHPDRLEQPLHWRKPRRVFVNSMSDLFHPEVDELFIADVFAVMHQASRHTFQVLTKRPKSMAGLASSDDFRYKVALRVRQMGGTLSTWPLPNVQLGVSVENQRYADLRIPHLLTTPAAVRFLSCEPLLGSIDLTRVAYRDGGGTHLDVVNGIHGVPELWRSPGQRIDWCIVGGESGPGARPMAQAWARSLRDQCVAAGVPFFFKQWGGRVAKTAGRELDGRTWDEMP